MATTGAKAEMNKAARNRLELAAMTLRSRFGIEPSTPRPLVRDSELQGIYELEDMATFLERLVAATDPPKAQPSMPEPAKAEAVAKPAAPAIPRRQGAK